MVLDKQEKLPVGEVIKLIIRFPNQDFRILFTEKPQEQEI